MTRGTWAALAFAAAAFFANIPAASADPALIVEVKCKPGTAELWQALFDKEIVPSIDEAIRSGDGFTHFSYAEVAVPGQHFDFILIYEAKSFAGLDVKHPFPHYVALFRRVGPERGKQILAEMMSWEAEVHITLARTITP